MSSLSNSNAVPFVDLVAPHRELGPELVEVFRTALLSASFIGGPMVEEFEKAYAAFCGTQHCVGVGSGTDALRFALIASGVNPGDAVITVPNTFIATTEAISQAGGHPVFVDVDERSYNMNPGKLRKFLEEQCEPDADRACLRTVWGKRRVRAVVPVHLYGQMAEMDEIVELAEEYNLAVVEDACQAHGAEYLSRKDGQWKKAGSVGHAAAFSFYPGKNLGACGEAGAVTTNDNEIASKVRILRDHGQEQKYYHRIEGYNGRLDAIQAGVLSVKLSYLLRWNETRRKIAASYSELLRSRAESIILPNPPPHLRSVYHLYVARVQDRDGLRRALAFAGIGTGIHYPIPLHLQRAYSGLGYRKGDFPVSETVASEILSLPMYPQLRPEQQAYVVENISRHVCVPCPESSLAAASD